MKKNGSIKYQKNIKNEKNEKKNFLKNTVPLKKITTKTEKFSIDALRINNIINNNNNNNKKKDNNNKKDNTNKLSRSLNISKSLSLFDFENEENEENEITFNKIVEREKNYQYHDIKEFLDNVNLPELFNIFVKNKIYSKNQIENLTKKDLINMSINEKNRKIILERIEEMKNVPLEEFNGEFGIQCDDNNDLKNENFDFEENERIQSELFKKAVEEFRNAGKNINNDDNDNIKLDKSIKSITTNNTENTVINPKKFLFEIGGSDFLNLNNFNLFSDQANDFKDDEQYLPELCIGRACWNCFKRLEKAYPLNYDQKYFCSENCLNHFKNQNLINCSFCNKKFLKNNAVLKGDKKFCSINCFTKEQNKIEEKDEEDEDENNNNNTNNNNKNNNNKSGVYKIPDFITNPKKNEEPFEMIDILDL